MTELPLNDTQVALLNPYDDTKALTAYAALRQALRSQGVRLQVQLLYTKAGEALGTRIGLKDHSGFFAEYCFTRQGRMESRTFLRQAYDINGQAPAFWATD